MNYCDIFGQGMPWNKNSLTDAGGDQKAI